MGALHYTKWRLPAPDELKGTDAWRRISLFLRLRRLQPRQRTSGGNAKCVAAESRAVGRHHCSLKDTFTFGGVRLKEVKDSNLCVNAFTVILDGLTVTFLGLKEICRIDFFFKASKYLKLFGLYFSDLSRVMKQTHSCPSPTRVGSSLVIRPVMITKYEV